MSLPNRNRAPASTSFSQLESLTLKEMSGQRNEEENTHDQSIQSSVILVTENKFERSDDKHLDHYDCKRQLHIRHEIKKKRRSRIRSS